MIYKPTLGVTLICYNHSQFVRRALEAILNHPQAKSVTNRFGGIDIFEPSGRGARFDAKHENFLGFLQIR